MLGRYRIRDARACFFALLAYLASDPAVLYIEAYPAIQVRLECMLHVLCTWHRA